MADSEDGMVTLTTTAQDGPDGAGPPATTAPGEDELVITHNNAAGTYEAALGGHTVAGVVYSRAGDRVTLLATSVFPEFRGRGIAGRLLGGVIDELRAHGEKIAVACPFATEFINAHPEYADIMATPLPLGRSGDTNGAGQ